MPNTDWPMFHVKQNLFSRMIRFAVRRDRQEMAKSATRQLAHGADYSGPLAQEYRTYRQHLGRLTQDAGKYVLVHQTDIVDIYETYAEAYEAAYEKFGLEPFLVMHIAAKPILAR